MTATDTERGTITPALATIDEAGRMLACKRDTIYRLVRAGELVLVHVGAGARITVASIEAYLRRIGAVD
jgi:excisionase family DNA binding protein